MTVPIAFVHVRLATTRPISPGQVRYLQLLQPRPPLRREGEFVAEATALLREVMGDAPPVAICVVIDEVPADAWGYGGLSQEQRSRALSRDAV